jgi:hypothetical protein
LKNFTIYELIKKPLPSNTASGALLLERGSTGRMRASLEAPAYYKISFIFYKNKLDSYLQIDIIPTTLF